MAHEISGVCQCRICGEKIVGPSGIVITPGAQTNGRAGQFLLALGKHVIEKHPRENQSYELQAMEYLGMLRLTAYTMQDKAMSEQRDFLRWKIHQATLAHQLSDEAMNAAAAEFAKTFVESCIAGLVVKDGDKWPSYVDIIRPTLELQTSTKLVEIISDFRNLIQEPNKYALQVVTPH